MCVGACVCGCACVCEYARVCAKCADYLDASAASLPSVGVRAHRALVAAMPRTDRRWLLLVVAATAACDASRLGPTQPLRPRATPKRALRQEAAQPSSALRLRGGGGAAMSTAQGWSVLFAATGFELVSTIFMDKAEGFSKPLPSLIACLFYAASFYGFNLSLRALAPAARSKCTLGSALAWLLRLLRALGSALPGRGQPTGRPATASGARGSTAADVTAFDHAGDLGGVRRVVRGRHGGALRRGHRLPQREQEPAQVCRRHLHHLRHHLPQLGRRAEVSRASYVFTRWKGANYTMVDSSVA